MNAKLVGNTISQLRKRRNMTQLSLAKHLNVSDRTISKWETGIGYPDITLLLKLADVLGTTVDYILSEKRRGITIAGNITADIIKNIDTYPPVGMLTDVSSVTMAVGGCVPNTAIDLAKIDSSLPINVIGCIGEDNYGQYMLSQLHHYRIDISHVRTTNAASTGYADAMNLPNGERTIFHIRGANSLFSPENIDISALTCHIFHIGSIPLLDKFNTPDTRYGTVLARLLHKIQQTGIKTSIDIVSDSRENFSAKIIPTLPYCDYVMANENVCCNLWGLKSHLPDGSLNISAIHDAMSKTMDAGVCEKVIVHSKEAGFCLDHKGRFTAISSLDIPTSQIKGRVGVGNAFCAGCLYSIYNGWSDSDMLAFAAGAASCNLFSENAIDGMRTKEEIRQLIAQYPGKEMQ